MKTNKIVQKYVLKNMVVVCGYTLLAGLATGGAVGLLMKQTERAGSEKAEHKIPLSVQFGICGIVGAILVWYFIGTRKSANTFVVNATREYINDAINKYPDLGDFVDVLSNPDAMKYVAMVACNGLRKSEQQQIVNVISQTEQYLEPLKIADAYKQVCQIINDHIHVHPEYVPSIYAAMAHAAHTYFIPTKQNIR